jgi:hypothetical protein
LLLCPLRKLLQQALACWLLTVQFILQN